MALVGMTSEEKFWLIRPLCQASCLLDQNGNGKVSLILKSMVWSPSHGDTASSGV